MARNWSPTRQRIIFWEKLALPARIMFHRPANRAMATRPIEMGMMYEKMSIWLLFANFVNSENFKVPVLYPNIGNLASFHARNLAETGGHWFVIDGQWGEKGLVWAKYQICAAFCWLWPSCMANRRQQHFPKWCDLRASVGQGGQMLRRWLCLVVRNIGRWTDHARTD